MRRRSTRFAVPVAAALSLALLATACGSSDDKPGAAATGTGSQSTATTKEPVLAGTLNGSGSTFVKGFVEVSIAGYKKVQPGVTVNYAGGGSGTGRTNLQDGVVDFAGSDGLIADADKAKYKGGEIVYVPTVAAPITVAYNLSDVKDLVLDADTIAKVFSRQVKKWDDASIAALNPGVKLPATDIAVAHRSDGSGTTEQFTKYLVAAAPNTWTLKSGSTVEWPADTQAGNGNQGVAQIVKSTAGAVGYVDLSDAKASGLQFAKVKNKSGKAVTANLAGVTAALAGTQLNADLSYNPLNADGADAYPITAPTWVLVYRTQADKVKGEAVKSFLRYLVTDGQKLANDVDYATLPVAFQEKALAQIDAIVVPAP
jgi:phosphate transport system substrate-binding protein